MVRIGGLASGMDIDQIVSDLMKAERMPLDKLKQKKQVLEWQRDDYRAMNTLLLDFRSLLTQMKLTTNYRVRQATSTDESKLAVSASSAAGLTSYSIANVTQLASAETRINEGKIYKDDSSFDPSKSLFSQNESFLASEAATVWKNGAVRNKTISVAEDNTNFEIGDTNLKLGERTNWSVKVNGVGYKAVVESDIQNPDGTPKRPLADDEVLVKENGELQFNHAIAKGSTISVDYIANDRTDSVNLSKDSSSWQLSQGAINHITSFKMVKTTSTVTDGETTEETEEVIYNVGEAVTDSEGNLTAQITDESDQIVGTVNMGTGKITFTENMPLPPEQEKDANPKISMKLEATYDHKYTHFVINTDTSKGERHGSFYISGGESLNSMISKVNSSSVGVSMFYDSFTGQMSLTRTETGDFNESGKEITTYGIFLNDVLRFRNGTTTEEGKNAKFQINGLETERTSNTFEVNGVTFTLKQEFTDPVSTSISNNTEKVVENIKEFVEKYNEMIDTIRKKISEERHRDYSPLTDDQREELSDKQQEKWEEMAKSGLLRRDPTLNGVLTEMRMDFYQPVINDSVSGAFNQLAKIGIKTTANYLEGGKLEIDEAKLTKAIEEDPESVENLFRGTGTLDSQRGVVQRLYDTVTSTMDKLKLKAGNSNSVNDQFTIGKQLNNMDDSIDRFEDRLTQIESRYWAQFTAMEKAIQRSNSQMNYLMQQFGGY